MNTTIRISLLTGAVLLPLVPLPAEPAATSQDQPISPEAKPYVIFMRTDVSVEQNKQLYPIKDVSGRAFIVSKDGQKMEVPMVGAPHKIEFQYALTLARATASLTDLKSERAYSPGTDPRMVRQREAAMTNAVLGDNASLAEAQFIKNTQGGFFGYPDRAGSMVPRGTVGGPGGQGQGQASAGMAAGQAASAGRAAPVDWRVPPNPAMEDPAFAAFSRMNQADTMISTDLAQGYGGRLRAESDLALQQFDAVHVSFEFSSKVYLEKPYLVVITRFHAPEDAPGVARSGIFAKALDAIGSQPAKIDVLHGGFPPGFEIEDLEVHLYSDGREIPTDVARKCVPLSTDDAFEYLKIEYLNGHKEDTLLATPALGLPDKSERLKLSPNQWKADYYAKVSKDGVPLGTYLDEACRQPVDDLVATLAQNVRYYPAMEKGQPVEGIARLSWPQLKL
jgi:hypothetical protein